MSPLCRSLLQKVTFPNSRLALLASTSTALLFATADTVHAEGNAQDIPEMLPIYDDTVETTPLVLPPRRLDVAVDFARSFAHDSVRDLETKLQSAVDVWIPWEKRAEAQFRATVSEEDRKVSNALYIAVSGLAGTVVARNRNILVQMTLPAAFAVTSAFYFTPQTARTMWDKAAQKGMEQPAVRSKVEWIQSRVEKTTSEADSTVRQWMTSTREAVGAATGNVGKTYGEVSQSISEKVEGVKKSVASLVDRKKE